MNAAKNIELANRFFEELEQEIGFHVNRSERGLEQLVSSWYLEDYETMISTIKSKLQAILITLAEPVIGLGIDLSDKVVYSNSYENSQVKVVRLVDKSDDTTYLFDTKKYEVRIRVPFEFSFFPKFFHTGSISVDVLDRHTLESTEPDYVLRKSFRFV
jgi:hypothetical protein